MQQMQIEEGENLKFDIEILTEEKGMLEGEIEQISQNIKMKDHRVQEITIQLQDQRLQNENQIKSIKDQYER